MRLFFGIDQLAHDDADHVFHRYHGEQQRVFVQVDGNVRRAAPVGTQFFAWGHIDAVHIGIAHFGRGGGDIDFARRLRRFRARS